VLAKTDRLFVCDTCMLAVDRCRFDMSYAALSDVLAQIPIRIEVRHWLDDEQHW
jgi:hypothetical protein